MPRFNRSSYTLLALVIVTLLVALLVRRQTAAPLLAAGAGEPIVDVLASPEPSAAASLLPRTVDPTQPPVPSGESQGETHAQQPDPTPESGVPVAPPDPPRSGLIDRQRFFYEPDWYAPQIQAFLDAQPGPLKRYRLKIWNREHSFAEILSSQSSLYSINPRIVLALIEQQSGLISNGSPSDDAAKFMLGYRGEDGRIAGWNGQLRWAIRQLHHAQRDFPGTPELSYADQTRSPLPEGMQLPDYAIARVLAATTTAPELAAKLDGGSGSFVAVYTRLFGDPREPPSGWPGPAAPFLSLPMESVHETESFFDHDTPFLQPNGSIVTYRGDQGEYPAYDGHDGWDYGMLTPEPVLAAADGTVVFAGNSDDGCGVAQVVIIDHGNGYRTLYWHLARPEIEPGPVSRGQLIGVAGESGCAVGSHLHFQVQYLGRDTDPAGWCGPEGSDPWAAHPAGQTSSWLWQDTPSPCGLPANAVVVDTGDSGFRRIGEGWQEGDQGVGGGSLGVLSLPSDSSRLALGVWRPELPRVGRYRVLAWVPYVWTGLLDAEAARYVVGHADGSGDSREVEVNQVLVANGWADLGVYEFDPARKPFVGLAASDTSVGNNVWYDAVVWIPVE